MTVREFMALLPRGEFWVFGYGSLMWSPCFAYREKRLARAHGFHRALCILSTRYRGTHQKPGLVMGLCPGGSCWGMAFRIGQRGVRRCLLQLWQREMPRRVYRPRLVPIRLERGRLLRALQGPRIDPGEVGGLHVRHRQRELALHQIAIAAKVFDLGGEPGVAVPQGSKRRDIAQY